MAVRDKDPATTVYFDNYAYAAMLSWQRRGGVSMSAPPRHDLATWLATPNWRTQRLIEDALSKGRTASLADLMEAALKQSRDPRLQVVTKTYRV